MAMDQFPPAFPDDRENPYSAPRSEVGPEKVLYDPTAVRPEVGAIVSRSWEIYKERLGTCIGGYFAVLGLNIGVQLLAQFIQVGAAQAMGQSAAVVLLSLILSLGMFVFQIWLGIGLTVFMIRLGRGREAPFDLIFSGGRFILPIVLGSILVGLIVFGILMICLIPGGIGVAALGINGLSGRVVLGLFIFLAVIAYIVILIRLLQFYYLIIDRDLGVMDSLRISLEITKGNELTIFVIFLVTIAINILGLIACLVGLIFTLPLTTLMFAVMYLALTGQGTAAGPAEGLPELEPI